MMCPLTRVTNPTKWGETFVVIILVFAYVFYALLFKILINNRKRNNKRHPISLNYFTQSDTIKQMFHA